MPLPRIDFSGRVVDLSTGRIDGGAELRPLEVKLLRYLAERPGTVVGHGELLAHVWGYSPRSRTRTLYTTWHRLRAALEADPTAPRHLLTVPGRGLALAGAVPVVEGTTNLVRPVLPLVGRTEELARLAAAPVGWLTLVGPGGVGKTRLAVEHTWRTSADRPAWFCDVSTAGNAAAVAEQVASTLGVVLLSPQLELGAVLAERGATLIVVDDADGVDDLGPTLLAWVRQAPELRIVVTRRLPIGAQAERRFVVRPLACPPPGTLDGDGAALLVRAVRAADTSFEPRGLEAALGELVALLDGLPLALEIVAAQVAALGPAAVLDAVRRGTTLDDTHPAGTPRQRSMRTVLDWTWAHLPVPGRSALRQLTAFARSFPLDLAERVLDLPPGSPSVGQVVTGLVERGLVYRVRESGQPRFALLATVRSYLGPPGRGATDRHTEVYRDLALEQLARSGGLLDHVSLPQEEADEALHAARHALATPGDPRWAELLEFAVRVGAEAGRWASASALVHRALAAGDLALPSEVRLSSWWICHLTLQLRHDEALDAFTRLPARALQAGLPEVAAAVEVRYATALFNAGDAPGAAAALARAETWTREIRDPAPSLLAYLRGRIAHVRICLLPFPAFLEQNHLAITELQNAGRPAALALTRANVIQSLLSIDRVEEAGRQAALAVSDSRGIADADRAEVLAVSCGALRRVGRTAEALERVDEACRIVERAHLVGRRPHVWLERARILGELDRLDEAWTQAVRAGEVGERSGNQRVALLARAFAARIGRVLDREGHVEALLASFGAVMAVPLWNMATDLASDLADAAVEGGAAHEVLELTARMLQRPDLEVGRPRVAILNAEILRWSGRPAVARSILARTHQLEPGHREFAVVRVALASIAAEHGDLQEARIGLEVSFGLGTRWAGVHRARCAAALGRLDEAREAAATVRPQRWEALLGAAVADLGCEV